jgi:hypothetical protein
MVGSSGHGSRSHARVALLSALLVAAIALDPGRARAGNEDEFFVGNRAAVSAGAVVATVDDGSATHYNPAGLGAVERSTIDVSASAYALRLLSAPKFLSSEGGASRDAEVTEFVAIPTQIAYVRLLGERTALGLGYFVPRASDLLLREQLEVEGDPATGEPPSRWALDLRITAIEYLLSAGLGSAIGHRLRLGAALVASYVAETESATLLGGVETGAGQGGATHLSALGTGSVLGTELALGLQADLSDSLHLGVTLRSPRLRLWDGSDTAVSSTSARVPSDAGEASVNTVTMRLDESGEELLVARLGRLHVGLAWDVGDGVLSVGADVQAPLRDAGAGVRRRTTLNGRLGYVQRVGPGMSVGAGVFSDRASEELGDGPVQAVFDYYGVTAGLEIDDLHRLATGEEADSLIFSSVFALRYAYGFGDAQWVRVRAQPDGMLSFDPVPGSSHVHELGLHVGSALHF